jgi:hypothetical protein
LGYTTNVRYGARHFIHILKFAAVVVLNVLSFWEPLRTLIRTSIEAGFITPSGGRLVIFVDGPADPQEHIGFDWGKAALEAIDSWEQGRNNPLYDWSTKTSRDGFYRRT